MKFTTMKVYFILIFSALTLNLFGQVAESQSTIYPPFVNQLGYNLGESKRFVCYGAQDNAPFKIINTSNDKVVYEGRMLNQEHPFLFPGEY